MPFTCACRICPVSSRTSGRRWKSGSRIPSAQVTAARCRSGLKLVIEQGRLAAVEPWTSVPQLETGDAGFPGLTFLQILFGYRSFDELETAFADCFCEEEETRALLNILFPKRPSAVFPLA
jgi:hypothetical protein